MGIKVTRTYTNPYRAETTNYLKSNTGIWQKLKLTLAIETRIDYTQSNPLNMLSSNQLINMDGANWREKGFEKETQLL